MSCTGTATWWIESSGSAVDGIVRPSLLGGRLLPRIMSRCAALEKPKEEPMQPAGPDDAFTAKRAALREELLARHFLLGGWIGGTDTYKRTMWAAVPDIALAHAGYSLTMRKGLPEPGAGNQLIMAGHEAMLAQ